MLNHDQGNYDLLRHLLGEVYWSTMYDLNVQDAYNFFSSNLQEAVERSIPRTRPRSHKNLYMTRGALKLKRKKATLWSTYMQSRDPIDYAQYCYCRYKLRSLTRKLRSRTESEQIFFFKRAKLYEPQKDQETTKIPTLNYKALDGKYGHKLKYLNVDI